MHEWLASAPTRPPRKISRASNRTRERERESMSEVVLSRLSDKSDREKEKERQREGKKERGAERRGRGREGGREGAKKEGRERDGGERTRGRTTRARARAREGRGAGIVVVSSLQCIAFTIPRVPVTPRAPTNRVRRASHEEIHETSFAVERFGSSRFIERKSFCMRDNEHESIERWWWWCVCLRAHTTRVYRTPWARVLISSLASEKS